MNSTVKPENDIAGTATQRPLLSRDFVLLVAGQGISLFGNVMLRFAMSMWVLDETGSATIFASVLAISIVPTIPRLCVWALNLRKGRFFSISQHFSEVI